MIEIAPAIVRSLREALTNLFWYRDDLKSFLLQLISKKDIIDNADWSESKKAIVNEIIDAVIRDDEELSDDVIIIIREVCFYNDFSHFNKLDAHEAEKRIRIAKECIRNLHDLSIYIL